MFGDEFAAFSAVDPCVQDSCLSQYGALSTHLAKPYVPPVDAASILSLGGVGVSTSGNASEEGFAEEFMAKAKAAGRLDTHPEDRSAKTQAPVLYHMIVQRNALVRPYDSQELHQLCWIRRLVGHSKEEGLVPQIRSWSSMNFHLREYRKLRMYETAQSIRKHWNFFGGLHNMYAFDPLSTNQIIPYHVGVIAVDRVFTSVNYWMTCADPLRSSNLQRSLWAILKRMPVRNTRAVREPQADWSIPVSENHTDYKTVLAQMEEDDKMKTGAQSNPMSYNASVVLTGGGETKEEKEKTGREEKKHGKVEEEKKVMGKSAEEEHPEEAVETDDEAKERELNAETCWQWVPYVTPVGMCPPVKEWVNVAEGWTGALLYIGASSFVHSYTPSRAADVDRYIFAPDKFWHLFKARVPLTDVLLAPRSF